MGNSQTSLFDKSNAIAAIGFGLIKCAISTIHQRVEVFILARNCNSEAGRWAGFTRNDTRRDFFER